MTSEQVRDVLDAWSQARGEAGDHSRERAALKVILGPMSDDGWAMADETLIILNGELIELVTLEAVDDQLRLRIHSRRASELNEAQCIVDTYVPGEYAPLHKMAWNFKAPGWALPEIRSWVVAVGEPGRSQSHRLAENLHEILSREASGGSS